MNIDSRVPSNVKGVEFQKSFLRENFPLVQEVQETREKNWA